MSRGPAPGRWPIRRPRSRRTSSVASSAQCTSSSTSTVVVARAPPAAPWRSDAEWAAFDEAGEIAGRRASDLDDRPKRSRREQRVTRAHQHPSVANVLAQKYPQERSCRSRPRLELGRGGPECRGQISKLSRARRVRRRARGALALSGGTGDDSSPGHRRARRRPYKGRGVDAEAPGSSPRCRAPPADAGSG